MRVITPAEPKFNYKTIKTMDKNFNAEQDGALIPSVNENSNLPTSEHTDESIVLTNKKIGNIMNQSDLNTASENVVDNTSVDVQSSAEQQGTISTSSNCPVPFDKCLGSEYIAGTKAGTIVPNPNLKEWDGRPLQEGVVYHRNHMLGLPLCSIKENRDPQSRAKEWKKTCEENGMVNSGTFVKATVVKQAGFTPAVYLRDTNSWWVIPESLLQLYYLPMDGHGRSAGHDLSLEKAMKDPTYTPFDFRFEFKDITDPDIFYKEYQSVNQEVKKTTKSDLIRYASCHKSNPVLTEHYTMVGKGFVAKSSELYNFGRELSKTDINKANKGEKITVEQNLVGYMRELLETYKSVFSATASQKVLKGVPLARWTRDTLKNAADKKAMADKIKDKFSKMSPEQLSQLQDAKGVKGDRTKTTEIILIGIFNEILNS